MRKNNYNTVEEVYGKIGAESAKDISGEKLDILCSMLAQINPDVLEKIISGIPNYAEAIAKLEKEAASIFADDYKAVSDNEAIKALREMLDFVKKEASKEDLSSDEKKKLREEMFDIINKISEEQRKKEDLNRELLKQKVFVVIITIALVVITIGLVVMFLFVPGFVAETMTIIIGILLLIGIIALYNNRKREIKAKYKNKR